MYNFCTLFDSSYLSRGLVMYNSLNQHTNDFHLYIFAFDNLSFKILNTLNLEKTTIIPLEKLENQELLKVKNSRTKAEYCWTCTSSTISYVLENYNVPDCTYVDADLLFYQSPSILLKELNSTHSVLITEHRYSWFAKMYEEKRAGRFCVQFITFTNNVESKIILTRWINQCIDWCFDRFEDSRFGDQKYLDEWPAKYKYIQILNHLGGGVAPWNVGQYKIFVNNSFYFGIDRATKKKFDLIFFHFHFVRFLENGYIDLGWNFISRSIKEIIYYPYIMKIVETERMLSEINPEYRTTYYNMTTGNLREMFKSNIKSISKYNIVKIPIN